MACDDVGPDSPSPTGPTTPQTDAAADAPAADLEAHERLAKAIAASMADVDVRSSVLRAMQASAVHEHKLTLQRFLSRPAGEMLREEAIATGEEHGGQLGPLADELPEMDFYMPVRDDRRSWTGSIEVSVAAIMDPDQTERAIAFTPEGGAATITSPEEAPGALLLLHPAEPHVPGGPPAGQQTVEMSAGQASSVSTAVTANECLVSCDTDPGGGGGQAAGTWISAVSINFGDGGWGNAEIYFETCDTNGRNCEDTEDDEISVPAGGEWFGDLHLHSARASDLRLVANMMEADSGLNGGDDFKGSTCLALDAGGACVQEYIDGAAPYLSLDAIEVTGEYVVYLN